MIEIAPKVYYMTRAEWGADPRYPRLGGPEAGYALVPRGERFYAIWHHTVLTDASDQTPNIWEDLEWAKLKMQRLQTIRPDLGADVPYNFVLFFRPGGAILICEGRGYDRSGAHTAGRDQQGRWFNVGGVATSVQGDLENYAFDIGPWLPAINNWNAHLRASFPALTSLTVCGKQACGHKDYARFSDLNATACPGWYLYSRLSEFTFAALPVPLPPPPSPPAEEDDPMLKAQMDVAGLFGVIAAKIAVGVAIPTKERGEAIALLGGNSPRIVTPPDLLRLLYSYAAAMALRGQALDDETTQRLRHALA